MLDRRRLLRCAGPDAPLPPVLNNPRLSATPRRRRPSPMAKAIPREGTAY